MDTEWLRDFLMLRDTGSFSRAARKRNVSQPTFSKHIQSLEDWVGTRLINRETRPVALTPAGDRFSVAAEALLEQCAAARIGAQAHADAAGGLVVFAAAAALSQQFFPRWIGRYAGAYPNMKVRVVHCRTVWQFFELLANREADLLILFCHDDIPLPAPRHDFSDKPIGTTCLIPVSAPAGDGRPLHGLIGAASAPVPHLARTGGSYLGQVVEHHVAQWGLALASRFELTSTAGVRTMAIEGHGVAWLPAEVIDRDLETGRLVRASGDACTIDLSIRVYRRNQKLGPMAERIWEMI